MSQIDYCEFIKFCSAFEKGKTLNSGLDKTNGVNVFFFAGKAVHGLVASNRHLQ